VAPDRFTIIDTSNIANTSTDVNTCCPSVLGAPLATVEAEDLARGFAALADPVRLRLLSMIATADEMCSCNLVEPLGKSQPTISHHTKVLSDAGLIVGEKRGRWVYWRALPDRLDALRAALAGEATSGATSATTSGAGAGTPSS
jgi:ArsR family transcriptional regulator, arsenate/arsenite/antimonite-responsive transcriptional repressor